MSMVADVITVRDLKKECHAAKGKQTCSCFQAQLNLSIFCSAPKHVTINKIQSGF